MTIPHDQITEGWYITDSPDFNNDLIFTEVFYDPGRNLMQNRNGVYVLDSKRKYFAGPFTPESLLKLEEKIFALGVENGKLISMFSDLTEFKKSALEFIAKIANNDIFASNHPESRLWINEARNFENKWKE